VLKSTTATKACFVLIAAVYLIFNLEAKAKESKPISQKLWQEISQEDLEIIKKISLEINRQNYDEA
jgi:hypothetical protein